MGNFFNGEFFFNPLLRYTYKGLGSEGENDIDISM